MVTGMANMRKVTVTLPNDQVEAISRLVSTGASASVSGFVQHAVGIALDDVAGWRASLADALQVSGGDLTAAEEAWADGVLANTPNLANTPEQAGAA